MSNPWRHIGDAGTIDLLVVTERYLRQGGGTGPIHPFICMIAPAGGATHEDQIQEFASPSIDRLRSFVREMRPCKIVARCADRGDYLPDDLVALLMAPAAH